MSIFRRLFKVGEAQANSAIDSIEDPVKNESASYS